VKRRFLLPAALSNLTQSNNTEGKVGGYVEGHTPVKYKKSLRSTTLETSRQVWYDKHAPVDGGS